MIDQSICDRVPRARLAKSWLLSQFIATPSGNPGDDQYGECIGAWRTRVVSFKFPRFRK